VTLKNKLVGVALLGVAVSSSALTLGRARGAVVLGQPLSLAIEVRLDSPDEATAQCFSVEVLHGDVPIDPNRVRVVVQAQGGASQDAVIRIRSSAVIDEPVVGVVLQALCGQQGSRRYDFLPEFPPELLASQAPVAVVPNVSALAPADPGAAGGGSAVATPVPSRPPVPIARPPAVSAPAAPAPAPAAARPAPAPAPGAVRAPAAAPREAAPRPAAPPRPRPAPPPKAAAPKAAPVPTPAPAAAPAAASASAPAAASASAPAPANAPVTAPSVAGTDAGSSAAAGRSRLTLDGPGERPALRGTVALGAAPAESLPERAEAAAAWRALNASPEEALKAAERLQALETQEKAARDARQKAEAALLARLERAERRLDEAENNRVDIAIVYGMLALLLAAIAAAAFFWSRARKSAQEAAHWAQGAAVAADGIDSRQSVRPSTRQPRGDGVDSALLSAPGDVWAPAPKAASAVPAPAPRPMPIPFPAASAPREKNLGTDAALMRAANPEDFLDAQQHADFFVSLGQYDQAIEVLKKHIDDNAEMSPLAYLELMKIYHTLSRQSDYNAARQDFHAHFNARVPNFAAFTDEGIGLDDYPATMLSIETAWGTPRVLDTIEANIFRTEGDSGKPLDLAAYRDLLLLYAVAKTLARTDGESTGDTGGRLPGLAGTSSDSSFMPQRLTRPDFTASLNTPDASFVRSAAAPLGAGAAGAAAGGAAAGAAAASWDEPELDSAPSPLRSNAPDLALDLDLSNSLSLALDDAPAYLQSPAPTPTPMSTPLPTPISMPASWSAPAPAPALSEVDIDLPLLELEIEPETGMQTNPALLGETAPQPPVAVPAPKPEFDSGMIDFDLFDPNTEARIAPKSTR
jgi:pilus assembly protein FimV